MAVLLAVFDERGPHASPVRAGTAARCSPAVRESGCRTVIPMTCSVRWPERAACLHHPYEVTEAGWVSGDDLVGGVALAEAEGAVGGGREVEAVAGLVAAER